MIAPAYNCSTGAFTFNTQGSNGSPVEYFAVGITSWTTNAGPITVRPASDVQPFTLKARYVGQPASEITYSWDYKATCPMNARLGVESADIEPSTGLKASVHPNPVVDEFILSLDGVASQPVQLLLTDITGHTILNRTEHVLTNHHEVRLRLDNRPTGVYILTVVSSLRVQSLRLLKR